MRLFVALHLEPSLLAAVKETQDRLRRADTRSEVRWVGPQAFHLTLAFLGEVGETARWAVETALEGGLRAKSAPRLVLSGLGAFPSRSHPRVIWIGVNEAQGTLEILAQAVRAAVRAAGLEVDDKRFAPHLTLGRVREERIRLSEPLREKLSIPVSWAGAPVSHPRVGFVRSHLSTGGSRYETLHEWRLMESC